MDSTTHRTTTVKTTEVRSSAEGEAPTMTYRPSVNARTVVIQRSSYGGLGASSTSSSRERSTSYGGANIPSGAYALVSSTGVNAVKTSREQEKKDMQDLNERFASYIEKVLTAHDIPYHVLSTAKFYPFGDPKRPDNKLLYLSSFTKNVQSCIALSIFSQNIHRVVIKIVFFKHSCVLLQVRFSAQRLGLFAWCVRLSRL